MANHLIISFIYQIENENICYFQPTKCDDLLLNITVNILVLDCDRCKAVTLHSGKFESFSFIKIFFLLLKAKKNVNFFLLTFPTTHSSSLSLFYNHHPRSAKYSEYSKYTDSSKRNGRLSRVNLKGHRVVICSYYQRNT